MSRKYPCEPLSYDHSNPDDPYHKNPIIINDFYNLTSWKNKRNGAILGKVGANRAHNFKVADNFMAGMEISLTAELSDYPSEKLIVLGDLNIAPEEIDVPDPAAMKYKVSFRPEERAAFQQLLALGLHDVFREFNKEPNHYSWWDYRTRGFERNDGMRIDHILSSKDLLDQTTQSYIDHENRSKAKPSDHAPVFGCFTISE